MLISFSSEYYRLGLLLNDLGKRQLPFAAAQALTFTAKDTARSIAAALPRTFNRPTPFTQQGLGITSATKQTLRAVVFVKDRQAEYLRLQETGGTRDPKKTALVIPAEVRLNQYGNIPNRGLARAKQRKDVFVGKVGGVGGFWQRSGKGKTRSLKPLALFKPAARYVPRFGFITQARRLIAVAFSRHMPEAIERAMRTARR